MPRSRATDGGDDASVTGSEVSVVPSGSESDIDFVRGFAQRATEPDFKQRKEKGPFVYQQVGDKPGRHFYEKEEAARLAAVAAEESMDAAGTSSAEPGAPARLPAASNEPATQPPEQPPPTPLATAPSPPPASADATPAPAPRAVATAAAASNPPPPPAEQAPSPNQPALPETTTAPSPALQQPPPAPSSEPQVQQAADATPPSASQVTPTPPTAATPNGAPSEAAPAVVAPLPDPAKPTDPSAPPPEAQNQQQPDRPGSSRRRRDRAENAEQDDEQRRDMRREGGRGQKSPHRAVDRWDDDEVERPRSSRQRAPPSSHRSPRIGDRGWEKHFDDDDYGSDDGRGKRDGRSHPSSPVKQQLRPSSSRGRAPRFEDDMDDSASQASETQRRGRRPPQGRGGWQDEEREFAGDVSEWGRVNMEERDLTDDTGSATMSSGLSPRDTRPQLRPFDLKAATHALQYSAGQYSKAQQMRRDGVGPSSMGIADDLPTRMAYENLNTLAGMAGKVQDAILHNKRIFEHRMMMESRSSLKKAWDAWKGARYGSVAKQQKLRRALGRIAKGTLSRAFFAWKERYGLKDKTHAMKKKLAVILARGLLRRCFTEWARLARERWYKTHYEVRDRQIKVLEDQVRAYQRRPVVVLRNRRRRELLAQWYRLADGRRTRRQRGQKAFKHMANRALSSAWNAWVESHAVAKRRGDTLRKAAGRMANLKVAAACARWQELVGEQREDREKQGKAARWWLNRLLGKGWASWRQHVAKKKHYKGIMQRWKSPHMARALSGWVEYCQWSARMKLILTRAAQRLAFRTQAMAFHCWLDGVDAAAAKRQAGDKMNLEERSAHLAAENERLRRDNERFVRLIDSGEWGRGRVAEMVAAGEVLKGERDALLKLIQSLRREYEAVQRAKTAQEEEIRGLKDSMMLGGAARNRMLIKGGSSFNALVRAMKQDLVDGSKGASAKADPNLLYEIDKLSLDRVQVFPDGELNVEAVATANHTAAFARPTTQTRTYPRPASPGPLQRIRTPQGLPTQATNSPHTRPSVANRGLSVASAAPPTGGATPSRSVSAATKKVLDTLQSLTPAEVDRLQQVLHQERADGGGMGGSAPDDRQPGLLSTTPLRTRTAT